jgi:hypothetical protein
MLATQRKKTSKVSIFSDMRNWGSFDFHGSNAMKLKNNKERESRERKRENYSKYNNSTDSNSDKKHNLFVVATVVELPIWFHYISKSRI